MTKTLEPGTELDGGKYRIVRLLGQGGMGAVFEAEHRDTQKRVAIKCMHAVHAADPEVAERLVREGQATARVRHPNVVDIYDVVRDGTTVYLVMEYLEGEPLSHALLRRDLPMYRIIALLLPAIRGVSEAHKQGVIHRDLKPDNIFLAREGDGHGPVPKVLDFGISKLAVRGSEQRSLTRSGAAVGTPSYMSYEQLAGEADIDGRADVYAFGVILYEALTGQVPYDADTFPELMIRFASHSPAPPKQLRVEIPNSLSRVIMWALARDRAERIPSMEALARELEPFATRVGFEAERTRTTPWRPALAAGAGPRDSTPAAEIKHVPTNPRPPGRRLTVTVVLCLLLAAAIAVLLARNSGATVTRTPRAAAAAAPTVAPTPPASIVPPTILRPDVEPSLSGLPAGVAPPPSAASPVPRGTQTRARTPHRAKLESPATPPRDLGIY